MSGMWGKLQRKADSDKPLQGTKTAKAKAPGVTAVSNLGAVPSLEAERYHATQMRGAKVDGRRLPRTGRMYQMNIRANEKIVKEFDADATKLKLTRGAFFEKCYHAFKAEQGNRGEAFVLQAIVKLDQIAKIESKARGKVVTPEAVLEDMFVQRAEMLGMQPGKR